MRASRILSTLLLLSAVRCGDARTSVEPAREDGVAPAPDGDQLAPDARADGGSSQDSRPDARSLEALEDRAVADAIVETSGMDVDDGDLSDARLDGAEDSIGDLGGEFPPDVCAPACTGKECGPDGCGGSCGECPQEFCGTVQCVEGVCIETPIDCDDGELCTLDTCEGGACQHSPEPGPCQWPGLWVLSAQNPVLTPTPSDPDRGADNVYAADVLWHDGRWWMWYGGQGGDGHDAIFLARSDDLVSWEKHPSWWNPQPVVDTPPANHVNDPSVVRVGGTFYMFYTEAPTGENDEVHLATSSDGIAWSKQGVVLDVGPAGSWEPDRVGRPAVLHEDGEFRMWYDGQVYGVARHVGYATSPDGYSWTKHPGNPVVLHEGAVDVDRVGEWYVMLTEAGDGTKLYVAKDPTTWQYVGYLWNKSGAGYDAFGQVTPFLLSEQGAALAVYFGGASDPCWCKNRIAVAFPGQDVAGCADCLAGQPSCQAACEAAGNSTGVCGNPGSTDSGACCVCF